MSCSPIFSELLNLAEIFNFWAPWNLKYWRGSLIGRYRNKVVNDTRDKGSRPCQLFLAGNKLDASFNIPLRHPVLLNNKAFCIWLGKEVFKWSSGELHLKVTLIKEVLYLRFFLWYNRVSWKLASVICSMAQQLICPILKFGKNSRPFHLHECHQSKRIL